MSYPLNCGSYGTPGAQGDFRGELSVCSHLGIDLVGRVAESELPCV
ncbi:hypothetical protein NSERUTF1_2066 [Nocardia seriolae]|nr:hypothetical protein NSERUTF1_2066 [Nocardia seriolae]